MRLSVCMSMSERKRSRLAVREVIRAAEEPRPVLLAW
jgi:hypothetical protein